MASISILPTAKLFFMAVSNISADSLLSEEVRASPYDRQQQPVLKRYALVKSNRSSVKRAVRLIAAFALPIPVIVLHRGNLLRTFFHFFYCSFSNSLTFSYFWTEEPNAVHASSNERFTITEPAGKRNGFYKTYIPL